MPLESQFPQSGRPALPGAGSAGHLPLADLHEALADGQISARYQPVVRIADRRPVALEVLARLEHPRLGTLCPDLFIPAMEAGGLGWPLTQAVVGRAFADWQAALQPLGLSLAVNFPLDALLLPQARDWLDRQCAASGIPPALVTIELTESLPVAPLEAVRTAVARFHAGGYVLAIDDVGPDVRDHRLLLDLAFGILKLDKNLVRGSADNAAARAFLADSIAAARAARLTIVAEGIEDMADWNRMAALGIEQAQGFLIGRPMAARDVAGWHAAWCAPAPPPAG